MRHLRFALLGLVALTALLVGGAPNTSGAPSSEPRKVRPEVTAALEQQPDVAVIVSLRETGPLSTPVDVAKLVREVTAKQDRVLSGVTASDFSLTHRYEAVPGLAGRITASGVQKLAAHPDIVSIGIDIAVQGALSQSVPQINADDVQGLGFTGLGVVAAVLDTGIDTDHPDLADDLLSEECFLIGAIPCPNALATCSGAGCAEDDQGHGSHVSGIITSGGLVGPVGVAPDTGIRAYKVLDSTNFGSFSDILAAINHIIVNYPGTDLINLSLGDLQDNPPGTCDGLIPAVNSAINTLRAGGTTVFAISHNQAFKSGMSYPACISVVISVGAVYDANLGAAFWGSCFDTATAQDQVICFSNSDVSLDLLAPGCSTVSSALGGGTTSLCGTSMAGPHAVGAAALLLDFDASLTPDQIETCLERTGVQITDAANGITTPRVDALAALSCSLIPANVCTTYVSTDVPKAILDLSTVTSTISVGDSFTLTDVNVGPLDITHTFDSDLDVSLTSPDATSVLLFSGVGGSGNNFTGTILDDEAGTHILSGFVPFAGAFRPNDPVSALDGDPSAGVWTLEITDNFLADTGTLNSWSLELCHAVTPLDSDGDSAYDVAETNCGGDLLNPALRPERVDGAFAGADDDGDTAIDEALPPGSESFDCDGDGYVGEAEAGTPLCGNGVNDDSGDDAVIDDGCPSGPAQVGSFSEGQFNIETSDQDPCGADWPTNVFILVPSENDIDIQDIIDFFAPDMRVNTNPGDPNFSSRRDLIPGSGGLGNWLNVQDLLAVIVDAPPMLGGVTAINGPPCPWPP